MKKLFLIFFLLITLNANAIYKNTASQKVSIYAYDTSAEGSKTGDAANITCKLSIDGAAAVSLSDTNPVEIDATNLPGVYIFDLATTETNGNLLNFYFVSSTANISIEPFAAETITAAQAGDSMDVLSISGDVDSANNSRDMYNGTGYTDGTAPASRNLVSSIGGSTGSSTRLATSFTLVVGTEVSNTYLSTHVTDGITHQISDDAGTIDCYYTFDIAVSGKPNAFDGVGRMNGSGDDVAVQAYNWDTSVWDTITNIEGKVQTSLDPFTAAMQDEHVGTNGNAGVVRIRFYGATLSAANLYIDQLTVSFDRYQSATGYENAAVWLSNAGTSGTLPDVHGVADFPVDNLPDAITIASEKNLNRFEIAQGMALEFVQTMDNYAFTGLDYIINLSGEEVDNATIVGAVVFGTATGNGGSLLLQDCKIGAVTLPEVALVHCVFADTITAGEAGFYFFEDCSSAIAGTGAPVFDYGAGNADQQLNMRHYSGGIEIHNMGASGTDAMSLEGMGQIIIDSSCVAGTIAIRGNFTITDNSGGAVTLSDLARFDINHSWTHSTTRTLTDKTGFSLAADQSAVTIGTVTTNTDQRGTDGASTHSAGDVWANGTRTLTSFGTLVADVTTSVWGAVARTLTDKVGFSLAADQSGVTIGTVTTNTDSAASFVTAQADLDTLTGTDGATLATLQPNFSPATAQNVWEYTTRTLTAFDAVAADVWGYVTRTLTAGTKDSEIDAIKVTTDKLDDTLQDNGGVFEFTIPALANAPSGTGSTPAQMWAYTTRTVTGFYSTDLNTWTATVKKDGVPISGAQVWATSGNAVDPQPDPNSNIIYQAYSDANGLATLFLPDGLLNVYVYKAGGNFPTSPQQITFPAP